MQLHDPDGSARGDAQVLSLDGALAFGVPHAATVDGRHVVVTFFVAAENGFALAAASVDTKP